MVAEQEASLFQHSFYSTLWTLLILGFIGGGCEALESKRSVGIPAATLSWVLPRQEACALRLPCNMAQRHHSFCCAKARNE